MKKFNQLESAQKLYASRGECDMHVCHFVGVASPVSEILILFYSCLLLIMMQLIFIFFVSCLMHAHY